MRLNTLENRRDIQIDAVFDLEASKFDQFVMGGFLDKEGNYTEYWYTEEENLAEKILSIQGTIWAHFGGGYDYKWLLDHAAKRGFKATIICAGSRIVFAKLGKTILCDSWALIPLKLEKLTKGAGVEKAKLQLPCIWRKDSDRECVGFNNNCGGFCSIRKDMPDDFRQKCSEYLKKDCLSLFESLCAFKAFAAKHDIDLGPTIGGSAWKNARRLAKLPKAEWSFSDYRFVKLSYFGGRTQLYILGLIDVCEEFDVNGMYPWVLSNFSVPFGEHKRLSGKYKITEAFNNSSPGIYWARVRVPEYHIPPLPIRYGTAKNRIGYPTGVFDGVWTQPELAYAQSLGTKIIAFHSAIIWESEKIIVEDWVKKLFNLRKNVDKRSPKGTWLKLYANSLTGKFGMNPDRKVYLLNSNETPYICNKSHRDGSRCLAGDHIGDYITSKKSYLLDDCSHIEWAAYLTSYARITLHKQQMAYKEGLDVVYSDTDSVYCLNSRTQNIGDNLGDWQYQGSAEQYIGISPKCYSYYHNPNNCHRHGNDTCSGSMEVKSKGLRVPKGHRPTFGIPYLLDGIVGFKRGARDNKFFTRRQIERVIQPLDGWVGDRIIMKDKIHTRAPKYSELMTRR